MPSRSIWPRSALAGSLPIAPRVCGPPEVAAGEAEKRRGVAVAVGEAAAVAMVEAASTEAQQRRQRKWEAATEGEAVAEVVFRREGRGDGKGRTGRRGDVGGDRGRGGSRGAVAVAAWLGKDAGRGAGGTAEGRLGITAVVREKKKEK